MLQGICYFIINFIAKLIKIIISTPYPYIYHKSPPRPVQPNYPIRPTTLPFFYRTPAFSTLQSYRLCQTIQSYHQETISCRLSSLFFIPLMKNIYSCLYEIRGLMRYKYIGNTIGPTHIVWMLSIEQKKKNMTLNQKSLHLIVIFSSQSLSRRFTSALVNDISNPSSVRSPKLPSMIITSPLLKPSKSLLNYNQQYRMRLPDKDCQTKRKYSRISFKKREKLIEDVENNGLPLSFIAKRLKIKQSTARMILRKYKESGEFRTKNFKNKRNTDLREWGATKNAQKIQKMEQFDQNHSEHSSQALSQSQLAQVQPKIEAQQWQGNNGANLYWLYYMPACDYMLYS